MADRKISIIVEAITSAAQQKLNQMGTAIGGMATQGGSAFAGLKQKGEELGRGILNLENVIKASMAVMAIHMVKGYLDSIGAMAKLAAKNVEIAEGFTRMTDRIGVQGSRLVENLKAASRGTISQYQIMLVATKALDLGIATNLEDLSDLMKIAHVRAKRYGIETAEAYQTLIDGISSGRPMMLRHLGFLADTDAAYKAVTDSMGGTADELTTLQQKQAVYQYILKAGKDDLADWIETADDATDAFARQERAIGKLKQEFSENLIPTMATFAEGMSKLPAILDQLGYIFGVTLAGMSAGFGKLGELLKAGDFGAILEGQAIKAYEAAERMYAIQNAAAKGWITPFNDLDIKLQATRRGTGELDESLKSVSDTMDAKLKDAAREAASALDDYNDKVAGVQADLADRLGDLDFQYTQAAERASRERTQIENEAAQSVTDALAEAERARSEALRNFQDSRVRELRDHLQTLAWMRQDFLDEEKDREWEHQRELQEVYRKAPWWIRSALEKEFAERERVAATGDKEALKDYDKALREKIRLIDPAYAEELDLLAEQYEHQEDIEQRENKKALERQDTQWQNWLSDQGQNLQRANEQIREALDRQQTEISRKLEESLATWRFNESQRAASERRSYDELREDAGRKLNELKNALDAALFEITPVWALKGKQHGDAYVYALKDALTKLPVPAVPGTPWVPEIPSWKLQAGMAYVPSTMLAMLHPQEAVLNAPQAREWREGGATTISVTVNVGGSYTPYMAQEIGNAVSRQLGRDIRQRSR